MTAFLREARGLGVAAVVGMVAWGCTSDEAGSTGIVEDAVRGDVGVESNVPYCPPPTEGSVVAELRDRTAREAAPAATTRHASANFDLEFRAGPSLEAVSSASRYVLRGHVEVRDDEVPLFDLRLSGFDGGRRVLELGLAMSDDPSSRVPSARVLGHVEGREADLALLSSVFEAIQADSAVLGDGDVHGRLTPAEDVAGALSALSFRCTLKLLGVLGAIAGSVVATAGALAACLGTAGGGCGVAALVAAGVGAALADFIFDFYCLCIAPDDPLCC